MFRQLTAIHGSARSPGVQRASRHAPPQQVGGTGLSRFKHRTCNKTVSLLRSNDRRHDECNRDVTPVDTIPVGGSGNFWFADQPLAIRESVLPNH